ncbi:MAG: hypothetical protein KBT68_03065 [bacterium]|nr:hypothetical protein [Candidatus Colisoma equi]
MKRLILTLLLLAMGLVVVESLKIGHEFWKAQRQVDEVYVVGTNKTVLCLGASCTGVDILDTNTPFKTIWVPNAFERVSVLAPLARLLEMERRDQLKDVTHCILESCLFSYASSSSMVARQIAAEMWFREFPVNWRYWDCLPISPSVYLWTVMRVLRDAAKKQWNFGFLITDKPHDRKQMISREKEWQEERIGFYRKRDFEDYGGYANLLNVVPKRLEEFKRVDEVCKRNDIKLIVMFPPMSSFYRNSAPAEAFQRYEQMKHALSNAGITIYDCFDRYPDKLFFDPTHLDNHGAEVFTKDLSDFLVRIK